MQPLVIVITQPARLVVEEVSEVRQPVRHRQQLVDLLLILHGGVFHLRVGEHISQFVRDRIGIDRHRNRAQHLRRHHRPIELGPVGADDGDGIAAPHADSDSPAA